MDHHCSILNKCICFTNYKQFLLYLFYTNSYAICYATSSANKIYVYIYEWEEFQKRWLILLSLIYVLTAGTVTFIIFMFHLIKLLFNNKTTMEFFYKPHFIHDDMSFNLGCCKNFKQVFGTNPFLWLLPIATSLGNGYSFEISHHYRYHYHH